MNREITLKVISLVCLTVVLLYTSLGSMLVQSQVQLSSPQLVVQSTPSPTALFNAHRAISHVSQAVHVPTEQLLLVGEFVQEFPLTGYALWRGVVLDRERRGQPLYEVIIETQGGDVLNSGEVEAVWEAEQAAYRARYSKQVLEHVAQEAGVPVECLQITNDVLESYPLTGVLFWQVKVLDVEAGIPYHLALGPDGIEVDPAALRRTEFEAHRARYGLLNSELRYRLQALRLNEPVPILIWVRGVDYEWVDAQLAQRYPELAAEYRFAGGQVVHKNGSPVQLELELFERVRADYNNLLDQAHLVAAWPVVDFLRASGYEAQPFELFPGVYTELPRAPCWS